MTFPFGRSVTLHKLRVNLSKDPYGNEIRVFDDWPVDNVVFWRPTTTDALGGRYQVESGSASLLWPAMARRPEPGDEVTADGRRWRVDGWSSTLVSVFTGTAPGILVQLEAVA